MVIRPFVPLVFLYDDPKKCTFFPSVCAFLVHELNGLPLLSNLRFTFESSEIIPHEQNLNFAPQISRSDDKSNTRTLYKLITQVTLDQIEQTC